MKKRDMALAVGGAIGGALAIKMFSRAKTVRWEDVADLVPHAENSHFVAVDGARVHYQEFGDAGHPTMILIHGYTASVYVWNAVAPVLADAGFHVIAVDLLGFGYSEKPRWFDYSIRSHANLISRFMNRLGIGRAHIVGSSYGGAVALTLALDYAETVERLILVDAVINDEPKQHPILRLAALPGLGEIITPILLDSKKFLRRRMQTTIAKENHHLITEERLESIRRPLFAADAHHSVLATSRAWHADRIEQDAHLIRQPTLIIWGEKDRVVPIKHGYKLRQEIPGSRLVVLTDCGHVPPEERSELFAELVIDFCRAGAVPALSGEVGRVA